MLASQKNRYASPSPACLAIISSSGGGRGGGSCGPAILRLARRANGDRSAAATVSTTYGGADGAATEGSVLAAFIIF